MISSTCTFKRIYSWPAEPWTLLKHFSQSDFLLLTWVKLTKQRSKMASIPKGLLSLLSLLYEVLLLVCHGIINTQQQPSLLGNPSHAHSAATAAAPPDWLSALSLPNVAYSPLPRLLSLTSISSWIPFLLMSFRIGLSYQLCGTNSQFLNLPYFTWLSGKIS